MVLLLADKQGCVGGNVEQEREREREGERERDLGWQGQSSPVTFLDDASMPFDCPPSLQYLESTHPPFSLLFRLPLSLPSTSLTFPSHPTLLPTTSLFSFPFPLLETLSYSFTLLYSFLPSPSSFLSLSCRPRSSLHKKTQKKSDNVLDSAQDTHNNNSTQVYKKV